MQPTLNIALRAARTAAEKVQYTLKQQPTLLAEGASIEDIYKDMLEGASARVAKTIRAGHPGHNIIVLQTGLNEARKPEPGVEWQVNLLSGEQNFIKGFPYFAVTVAQVVKGRVEHAAVVNPMTNDEFTVSRGRGVALNEVRVRAGSTKKLEQAMAATNTQINSPEFNKISQAQNLRLTGCAMLDFAWLATGALDLVTAENMAEIEVSVAAL